MDYISTIIVSSADLWKPVGYLVFFLAMLVEGEIFLFVAAFLTQQGVFNPFIMAPVVLTGITVGDILWYRLGLKLNHSASRLARWAEKISKPFDHHLSTRPMRTIMISKFIYGVHRAIIIRSGILKIDFHKFLKYDFRANLIWLVVVGGLGYASGASYHLIKGYLRFAEIAILGIIILFLILERLLARLARE